MERAQGTKNDMATSGVGSGNLRSKCMQTMRGLWRLRVAQF